MYQAPPLSLGLDQFGFLGQLAIYKASFVHGAIDPSIKALKT